ncbi:MAG: hypothetical protein NT006_11240 [Candidatus Aminicenantes bacterium]|nr:hypothetical protein [Candidatus Aminicenantes bacterium]
MTQTIPRQRATAATSRVLPGMPRIFKRIARSIARVASKIKGTSRTSSLTFPGRFSALRNQRQTMVARRAPMTETTVRSMVSSGKR